MVGAGGFVAMLAAASYNSIPVGRTLRVGPPDTALNPLQRLFTMYSVTKRIEFCYGHRLLDYDGVCKHPHGHNAVAEIEVRTGTLDSRNMVCDFSDIKRVVKGWIDAELDHKMVLRHDDPLVKPLQALGEPIFIVDSNPTVEHMAKLIFDHAAAENLPVVRVTVWETPTSFAEYRRD
jgi:6-pyruvoyltetrahydropterin/6-carboxytetrahydropterin synthase